MENPSCRRKLFDGSNLWNGSVKPKKSVAWKWKRGCDSRPPLSWRKVSNLTDNNMYYRKLLFSSLKRCDKFRQKIKFHHWTHVCQSYQVIQWVGVWSVGFSCRIPDKGEENTVKTLVWIRQVISCLTDLKTQRWNSWLSRRVQVYGCWHWFYGKLPHCCKWNFLCSPALAQVKWESLARTLPESQGNENSLANK